MKAHLINSFYIFITAMFSSLIMVPFLRRWALDKGIVDTPGGRKNHLNLTPRLGGIAIAMSMFFAMLVFVDLTREIRGILAGVMVVFFTGLLDDLVGLTAKQKLIGEIGGAVVAIMVGGVYLSNLGNLFGTGDLVMPGWLGIPFTVFAVIGVVNAINLIDGLDGLSGGVSVIALAAFFLLGLYNGNVLVMVMGAGLLGALLGFLKYNFFPARIFMGDTGSLVIGFMLAFISIQLTQTTGSSVAPVIPLIILGVPIIDTLQVMGSRLLRGQSPFVADRTHIHHKFLDLGFQHRFTVIIIYSISLFWGGIAVFYHKMDGYLLLLIYAVVSCLFYLGLRIVLSHRNSFPFFSRDSSRGIRETVVYRFLSEAVYSIAPPATAAILLFFVTAAMVSLEGPVAPATFTVIFSAATVLLILLTNDLSNQYVQAFLYSAGMVAAFTVRKHAGSDILGVIRVGQMTDLLLAGIALFVLLRLLFRRPGDFFLNAIDYLFLGVCLLLAVVSPKLREIMPITGTLGRGVLVFMGLKAVGGQGRVFSWGITCTLMAMLFLIVANCLLGVI